MDLRNILPHMKGASVRVNGNLYSLDQDGIIRDVAENDAKRLLLNSSGVWRQLIERTPVQEKKEVKKKKVTVKKKQTKKK